MSSRLVTAVPVTASALLLLFSACTGSVGENPGGRPSNPGGNPSTPGGGNVPGGGNAPGGGNMNNPPVSVPPPERPTTGACKDLDPGPSPLRLLTRNEYGNTVRDLFAGAAPNVLGDLPEDGRPARGYANDAYARSASDAMVAGYLKAAEKLAAAVTGDLSKIVDCDPGMSGEQACLDKFLDGFGKRAWRRPLTAAEKQNLVTAFNEGKAGGKNKTFAEGIEAAITVMLISPQFLYRYEQGVPVTNSKFAQLTSWEVASRLSYLLWGSMPDAELMDAAQANKLTRPADVMVQARRMVNDARFTETISDFGEQFLHLDQMATLDKDPMTLPEWKPELREAMRLEGRKFLEHVLKEGEGKLSTFLTAPYTFANGPLAQYYGVQGPAGDTFQKVNLDPTKHSGFLTQSGFLSVHGTPDKGLTSLVFRGIFVRESLLCQPIPDPPPNAEDENPPFTPTTTPREWAFARMAKPVCGSCHQQTDHIGFGFEKFDAIGKFQTTDRGKPVDDTGMLDKSDVDGPFTGVVELGKKLAGSKMVGDCMATQWFRFASGRAETDRDACSVSTLQDALNRSGGDMRELFVAYTQTDAFLFRSKGDQ